MAPSDFLLFEHLKAVLQRSSFDKPDELLSAIQGILRGIDGKTSDATLQEWLIRLQKYIDGNGEYAE
jgi:hypothetical protein